MPDLGDEAAAPGSPVAAEEPAGEPEALSTLTLPDPAPGLEQVRAPTPGAGEGVPVPNWERYEFLALLGRGGMGEVYKARDRRLGRVVALKFIRGFGPELAMRFLQEARAQARIDHPNVCKVYEVGEVQGKAYIAMQFVDGQRLDRAAVDMSQPEKVRVMQEVATAIHEAHRQGVIHRDLKPSNIVVERGESGRYFPVVMDFGLAYDVSHGHGLTLSGAVMGTPSYMAPEQARGDLSNIDRRSDVYSLGATLYELLVGEAPFLAATLAGTLEKVLHEEPPSLHSRVPRIERDLEIIVLKCLSKEPQQRYPSARALSEDLSRFLDGEPIIGRRPSLPYRLRRLARKHRVLVAVSGASLAAILLLAAFGVSSWVEARRTQQQSEERARLAEQLGQEVKEIEWFLRLAYSLPLHDTRHEQQRVRERMARIEAHKPGLDASGEALVSYALGRGHLALREFDEAHAQLRHAQQLGLGSPELHYALGQVLGELYHQAMEQARRSGGKDWLAVRQRELERQYLEPARASLEHSQGLALESPHYLEGLIAFYRQEYDVAARAAAKACAEAPWLNETWRLAGDIARVQAVEQLEANYDAARSGLKEAARLYERAIAMGGSDTLNYEALAEVWLRHSELDDKQGHSPAHALEQALTASEKSIQAAPLRSAGFTQKAYALMRQYWASFNQPQVQDVKPLLEEWIATGLRAVELNPRDVSTYDALGIGYISRAEQEIRNGQEPGASFNQAIVQLSRALELQPQHPWALNDLGTAYLAQGRYQREHGQDPRPALQEASRHFEQAARADPKYLYALVNLGTTHQLLAAYALSRGLNPEAQVKQTLEAVERSLSLDPTYYLSLNKAALAELTYADYLFQAGQDPRPALERARQYLERALRINPAHGRTYFHRAMSFSLEAAYALQEGHDPSAALDQGRQELERALQYEAGCVGCRLERARVALTAAAWEQRRGSAGAALLQQALTEARRGVEMYPYYESHQELARVYWQLARSAAPAQALTAVSEGLKQVELALRLDPGLAQAHAIRGGLLLVRARRAREPGERRESLLQAHAALMQAVELNPLLRRQYEPSLREVELLSREPR